MNKVVITGANGLLGSHIVEYFLSKGINPICLVRKKSNYEFLKSLRVEIIFGDITNLNGLIKIFNREIDCIIHTAAKVSDWGIYDDFYKVNVEGTINLLKASIENNIKNIIITGSVSCYGEESSPIVKDEDYPYNSHYVYFLDKIFPSGMNYYRDSKALSNIKAIEFSEKHSINLTILDPAWIYGERELHSGFYDFLKLVKSGIRLLPGSKKNKFHSIYARDLAKIYYLAYKNKPVGINRILAVSPFAEYQYKILDMFCKKAGYKTPFRIPKAFIYFPALLLELLFTVFNVKSPPPMSRGRINIFYDNIEYSAAKLKDILGFQPDYSFEESIENTVRWYKENNYL